MQRHQCDARVVIVLIGVTYQRCMIQELVKRFSPVTGIACCVDQFLQVFNAGERLGCSLFFKLLHIAAAIDKKFDNFRQSGRTTRSSKRLRIFFLWCFTESFRGEARVFVFSAEQQLLIVIIRAEFECGIFRFGLAEGRRDHFRVNGRIGVG